MKVQFPFGSTLRKVEQQDKSPKKVFVLGVYASAVHAKWIGADRKIKVNALAVASEPYIFWKGDDAQQIINGIEITEEFGKLIPADERFNGPSGIALDELFLAPLGLTRNDVWLCDILPFTRLNSNQVNAIKNYYNPLVEKGNLLPCTIPEFTPSELGQIERVGEILDELQQSKADTIILLGELPIKYFLAHFTKCQKLSDFGTTTHSYGNLHKQIIAGKTYQVLPLVHPRQAAALGKNSPEWQALHQHWLKEKAHRIGRL
jgi:uracil-DNA glycosylase